MKITDYAPRAAAMDYYLKASNAIGVEVGVDVGAHAQALLEYCSVGRLILVDPWTNDYSRGYCEGRLVSRGYKNKIEMLKMTSHQAAARYPTLTFHKPGGHFNFVYLDIPQDYDTVREALTDWWPLIIETGSSLLACRGYSDSNPGLKQAVDEFSGKIRKIVNPYHNEIILFK